MPIPNKLDNCPHCPTCEKKMDGFTAMEKGTRPSAGDFSVCAYCGEIIIFTDALELRKILAIDPIEECDLTHLQIAQKAARAFRELFYDSDKRNI